MFGSSASDLLWWANEIRIWASALAGVAAVITFLASYGQIRLQSIVSAEKDDALRRFQAESAERTAAANADAARANERAATLENTAAQALLEQERLRQLVSWRTINAEALSKLARVLSSAPSAVTIAFIANDPESLYFAGKVSEGFDRAKWTVAHQSRTYPNRIFWGIHVPGPESPAVTLIRQALTEAGLSYSTGEVPDPAMMFGDAGPSAQPLVLVGSKRPPF